MTTRGHGLICCHGDGHDGMMTIFPSDLCFLTGKRNCRKTYACAGMWARHDPLCHDIHVHEKPTRPQALIIVMPKLRPAGLSRVSFQPEGRRREANDHGHAETAGK